MHSDPAHVPELAVTDCEASLIFWRDHLGFSVLYARPAEGFAYLTLGTAHLMLDQIGLGRTWEVAPLTPPLGRGINLQVSVLDLDAPLERLTASGRPLSMAPEEKWYQVGDQEAGVHQFLVQDPDGYLVRVQSSLGRRPVPRPAPRAGTLVARNPAAQGVRRRRRRPSAADRVPQHRVGWPEQPTPNGRHSRLTYTTQRLVHSGQSFRCVL